MRSTVRSTSRWPDSAEGPLDVPPKSNTTPAEYKAMVLKAKDYIAAGDAFQIVLAQRFEAPFTLPPFSLITARATDQPSPYLYFLDFGDFAVAGSSPEILVESCSDDVVTIRPIAGTRPRGPTPHEDKALEAELLADPKERAEHLMLLDLGRNDVGRAWPRSAPSNVTDQFFVERYSHVITLFRTSKASSTRNTTRSMRSPPAFRQVRCRGRRRCAPCRSSMNWKGQARALCRRGRLFSAAGEMDTCIVLRTALVKNGTMYVQAGAGIVADSDPAAEQQECCEQGKGPVPRGEEARRFASAAKRGQ